jgi:hypothetical protein
MPRVSAGAPEGCYGSQKHLPQSQQLCELSGKPTASNARTFELPHRGHCLRCGTLPSHFDRHTKNCPTTASPWWPQAITTRLPYALDPTVRPLANLPVVRVLDRVVPALPSRGLEVFAGDDGQEPIADNAPTKDRHVMIVGVGAAC